MKILTFDIEEWALIKEDGSGTKEKYAQLDSSLQQILELLDTSKIKATFFCTGLMAKEFPHIVKKIKGLGHEIGCHSHRHTWMNKLTVQQAKDDTHFAIDEIEQCIGSKVLSYRAPAFSIGKENEWMFEILANEGITRDASIFPALRDFGGFPDFGSKEPCLIKYKDKTIKEFPICTTNVLGKEIAYSGGGYFRFFPLNFIKRHISKASYTMCYFHIADLIAEAKGLLSRKEYEEYFKEPGTLKNRLVRHFKTNYGKRDAWKKLMTLISSIDFINLEQADLSIDWENKPVVSFKDEHS